MIIKMLTILFSLVLDLLAIFKMTDSDKDLEIVILRQQVRILQRKVKTTPRITDPERMVLATLTDKFKRAKTDTRQRLDQVIMIFKPETMLRWHRELVRRKWTYKRKGKPGRPRITAELEVLIVCLAKENTRWGYERIQGELLKLGYTLCPSTVGNVLKRHGITPACERSSSSWRKFLRHYKEQMLSGKVKLDTKTGKNKRQKTGHEKTIQTQTKSPNRVGTAQGRAYGNADLFGIRHPHQPAVQMEKPGPGGIAEPL